MKNIFITFITLIGFFQMNSILATEQQYSNITGVTHVASFKKVGLYKVLNGRLVEVASSVPDGQGRFGFRFVPEYEGLYAIGAGDVISLEGLHRFYLKGNEELNVKLNQSGYELDGKNSKENEALYAWDKQSRTIKEKGTTPGGMTTYVDFFPELEEMKGRLPQIINTLKTGDPKFDSLFPSLVDNDFAYYAISYLYMPRAAHPSNEEMSDFYTSFNADRYLTDALLNLPYGDRFLSMLVYRKADLTTKPSFETQVEAIPSNALRGQYIMQRLENVRTYKECLDMKEKYKKYLVLPEQLERLVAVESRLIDTKTGTPAFQFGFTDINNKQVGLNDLRGKVVLLDLWATWCGPCREEEPHWEKLNEEFKDKAVAFVGISVDKDKPKWEEYIKTKKPKGIQLHAGTEDPLSAAYKVTGIPRYILIDKTGHLISADSPRPSDPKLKALLEEWLKK